LQSQEFDPHGAGTILGGLLNTSRSFVASVGVGVVITFAIVSCSAWIVADLVFLMAWLMLK
jgi:hypothetical protein